MDAGLKTSCSITVYLCLPPRPHSIASTITRSCLGKSIEIPVSCSLVLAAMFRGVHRLHVTTEADSRETKMKAEGKSCVMYK